jgi:predicted nucleic acid-binding Zn finger protein
MALSSVHIPADPKRDASARELLKTIHTWSSGELNRPWGAFEKGTAYLITPNGYTVNAVFCSCCDYIKAGMICKHIRAVVLHDAEKITKPKATYGDLFPSCWTKGCTNDLEPGEKACWRHMNADAF